MTKAISKLVILGGGSAGWMTAAMLAKQLNNSVEITLVESDAIGTIGVGEATIPPIKQFNHRLGLDENEFLSRCNGSIKLGIEFEHWGQIGDKYMHPFGSFGANFDFMPFRYFYMKAKLEGDKRKIQDFAIAWHLAKQNKFRRPETDNRSVVSNFDYAYHFDATLYGRFLRDYAEKLGVTRVEGKIQSVEQHPVTGFIQRLALESGQKVDGDFFVDCSGQHALLISKTLGIELEDWSHYLFNDSAVAIQTAHTQSLKPYTRSIAHRAGWQWRIPLQTRMGNGNVYSSHFMSQNEATDLLLNDVEGPVLTEPNPIRFKTGRKTKVWEKNCIAIGLSAGFLEPLESTSLHLIQTAIMRLVKFFPDSACDSVLQSAYNKATAKEFEEIRDFIVLHYKATTRSDSPYWQACRDMSIPDTLQERLELFKAYGHLVEGENELFRADNWIAVLDGQNIHPKRLAPIMKGRDHVDLSQTLNSMEAAMQSQASQCTSHEMYLAKHCPFKAL